MSPPPKGKKKYFLLNIKASQKLTQNINCLGIFFIGRVEHTPNKNLAILDVFGSFSKKKII